MPCLSCTTLRAPTVLLHTWHTDQHTSTSLCGAGIRHASKAAREGLVKGQVPIWCTGHRPVRPAVSQQLDHCYASNIPNAVRSLTEHTSHSLLYLHHFLYLGRTTHPTGPRHENCVAFFPLHCGCTQLGHNVLYFHCTAHQRLHSYNHHSGAHGLPGSLVCSRSSTRVGEREGGAQLARVHDVQGVESCLDRRHRMQRPCPMLSFQVPAQEAGAVRGSVLMTACV